jgi:hypothetical protein
MLPKIFGNTILTLMVYSLGFAFFQINVFAHHSTIGRFSSEKTIEISGIVTDISWRNPHSLITVEVQSGTDVESWLVESIGITALKRAGLDILQLQQGDHVIIGGPDSMLGKTETFLRYLVIQKEDYEIAFMGERPSALNPEPEVKLTGVIPYAEYGDKTHPELGIFKTWVTLAFS